MNNQIKTYWNGLEEYHNTPDFQENLKKEFQEEIPLQDAVSDDSLSLKANRRDFLKIFGFGLTAAALAACQTPVKKAIPFLVKPDNVTPGVASWYATTCHGCAAGCGLLVKSREGRPVKIEGNDKSPLSMGGVCSVGQGTILSLYDSNRLKKSAIGGTPVEDKKFDEDVVAALKGGGVRVLSSSINSPTTKAAIDGLLAQIEGSKHVSYDAVSYHAIRKANQVNFGVAAIPSYDFSQAQVIASFGADFLGTWISPVEFTKGYVANRKLSSDNPNMSRHYHFEAMVSMTGSNADYRFPVDARNEAKAILNLYNKIAAKAGETPASVEAFEVGGSGIANAANDLWANKGKSLVVSGSANIAVQQVVNAINYMLGNYGTTINISQPSNQWSGDDEAMAALVEEMNAGQVKTLILLDVNPVYNYFDSAKFEAGLGKVANVIALTTKLDETTSKAKFQGAVSHFLESWDISMPKTGHYSLTQPLVRPLFETRQMQDFLLNWSAMMAGTAVKSYYDFIREWWSSAVFPASQFVGSQNDFWENSVRDGVFSLKSEAAAAPAMTRIDPSAAMEKGGEGMDVVLYQKAGIRDGKFANNPWLQEMPDPVTKVTWDNYVSVPMKFAKAQGLQDGDMVTLTVGGKSVQLPVLLQPGQAANTLAVALGYGRTMAGKVADKLGQSVFPMVSLKEGSFRYSASGASLAKASGNTKLAKTQYYMGYEMEEGEGTLSRKNTEKRIHTSIVKETTLDEYKKDQSAGNHNRHHIQHENTVMNLWNEHPKQGYHWAMAIDLNACTGCGACIVSCNAENNVPVVGKKEVATRREMHWMRLDRYYTGDPYDEAGNLEVVHQPVMCQHCNHASCETVCPVLATVHSDEGYNQQVYNRCIGTRYCANNCAYKVRRFNWFSYYSNTDFKDNNPQFFDDIGRMVLNPDVNVRARGVMEKCSMCVQRIQEGKLKAKSTMTPVKDGDIRTACQQSCPANAIVFGNLNDPESEISKLFKNQRAYHALEEVKTLPSVIYLTKVRNKTQAEGAGSHQENAHHS